MNNKNKSLHVNLDHIATLRQARGELFPSVLEGCKLTQESGVSGITLHLREDRRHIQDNDLFEARKIVNNLTMEMATTSEMLEIAKKVKPNLLTLVPEKREELTTEGGLNIQASKNYLKDYISEINNNNLQASFFIEPDLNTIELAKELNASHIELHTGLYANTSGAARTLELNRIKEAASFADSIGLQVNAGHGLDYKNLPDIIQIPEIQELHIGFAIIARAVFIGLKPAIEEITSQI